MKKKIFLLAAVVGLFLLLTGCVGATTTSELKFTDTTGAGTKTITFAIPQDKETVVETGTNDEGETTYTYTIYNNSSYFPQGYEAFVEWVIAQLPANGYTYTIDKTTDPDFIYVDFSYSFTSFADYTAKTKALMGEERWADSKFVDPQLYVEKVEDPEDNNYGKLKLTFAESHYMNTSCVARLLEIGISEAAIEAGVFHPFGNVADNADCKAMYNNTAGEDETWRSFAITQFMAIPSNVCDTTGDRTYIMGDNEPYVESLGQDGKIVLYVEDDGTWTVTDPIPEVLGTKCKDPQDPKTTNENGDEVSVFEVHFPEDGTSSWLIIVIIIAVVAVAAVVVIAVVIKKKNDEYEDDDDEDDEDDEDEDDDEE